MTKFALTLCLSLFLVACGPHEKSPAEIAHEKHVAAVKAATKRHKEAAQRAAESRLKKAQEAAKIAAMPHTPPGIEQMDSTHFYVHSGFEGNTRDLCRTGSSEEPAGIQGIRPYGHDMIITCNNAEHEYKHEPFTTNPATTPTPSAPSANK